jgi:DNA-binding transcriptional regulator YiaG
MTARHAVYCAVILALAVLLSGFFQTRATDRLVMSAAKDSVIANRDLEIHDLKKENQDLCWTIKLIRDDQKLDKKRFTWYLGMIGQKRKYERWENTIPGAGQKDVP